jgi:hypothetical protein
VTANDSLPIATVPLRTGPAFGCAEILTVVLPDPDGGVTTDNQLALLVVVH